MSAPCCTLNATGLPCNCAQPFADIAKASTRQKDWNALRAAIRNWADHEEIERLWERCERWL